MFISVFIEEIAIEKVVKFVSCIHFASVANSFIDGFVAPTAYLYREAVVSGSESCKYANLGII